MMKNIVYKSKQYSSHSHQNVMFSCYWVALLFHMFLQEWKMFVGIYLYIFFRNIVNLKVYFQYTDLTIKAINTLLYKSSNWAFIIYVFVNTSDAPVRTFRPISTSWLIFDIYQCYLYCICFCTLFSTMKNDHTADITSLLQLNIPQSFTASPSLWHDQMSTHLETYTQMSTRWK